MDPSTVATPPSWPDAGSPLVIVDFSAIAYACWATAERAQEAGEKAMAEHLNAGAIGTPPRTYNAHEVLKGNLRMKLDTIVSETPAGEVNKLVMVKDSRAQWKYDSYPGYKAKRGDKYDPRPEGEEYLRKAFPGMQWVRAPGNEADDAIAALVAANRAQRTVVVVSGDKDLWQLWDPPHVQVYNPITKKYLTAEKVAEEFWGLDPKHIRACKAFWGDPSDNLLNAAPRMQKLLVPLIRAADGDLFVTLALVKSRATAEQQAKLVENLKQMSTNWVMAGLNANVDLEWK